MNYIDLFAGSGGFSLGFEWAGFENVFANEYDKQIAKTYKANFPNNKLIVDDIKNIDNEKIVEMLNGRSIDVVIGGPPCQGFSIAGKIGRSFIEDERNYLFKEFVRFVEVIKPKVFVMENVARMASHNKGKTINEIRDEFEKLGYYVDYQILQAANYNVPQRRSRVFVVGTKSSNYFEFPFPNSNVITVEEAIGDLPQLQSGEKSEIPNHFAMNHTKQMLEKMSYLGDGDDRSKMPIEIRPKSGDIRKYIKYKSKEPSITITGDMRKVFHYNQNRALTSRELARLQSFPDDFVFMGTSISVQQQIGNAVPPKLAFEIAKMVKESLSENDK